MAEPLIKVSGLGFSYGSQPVLEDLSFELEAGRMYGIVGPNGAGKSTLVDLLAGLKEPGGGSVNLFGQSPNNYKRAELARRISLVPQEYQVNFPFTVSELVMMGRHPYIPRFGSPSDRDYALVEAAIRKLDLAGLSGKYITELSGGEKQRVVLSRAFAQDTELVLLDEPTANLDINHALAALAIFGDRARRGPGLAVAVMHDLNLAAAHCDELIFLKGGRIIGSGPTAEVLTGELVAEVFGVRAKVGPDGFGQGLAVSYRARSGSDV